ncbi:MAG: nucleotidyltransferase [Niabella sp.]
MNIFIEEHQQMLLALVRHKVKFMLIGGYAVIYHGYARTTGDMDVWLALGNDNKENLIAALNTFGIDEESLAILETIDFTTPQNVFYFGKIPRRIDFLTMISNVKFEDAFKEAVYFPLEGEQIPVIHYNQLILSKLTSERMKDKADIEELQRINKYKKGKDHD